MRESTTTSEDRDEVGDETASDGGEVRDSQAETPAAGIWPVEQTAETAETPKRKLGRRARRAAARKREAVAAQEAGDGEAGEGGAADAASETVVLEKPAKAGKLTGDGKAAKRIRAVIEEQA